MLGSVDSHFSVSQAGSSVAFFKVPLATKQSTATTEVRLRDGHKGTKYLTTIAAEHGWLSVLRHPLLAQSFLLLSIRH